jgi:hypothetical protein
MHRKRLMMRQRLPRNLFAIAPEFGCFALRRIRGEPNPPTPRLRRDRQFRRWCYQGITFRSLKNLPVIDCGASDANHTTPEAPCISAASRSPRPLPSRLNRPCRSPQSLHSATARGRIAPCATTESPFYHARIFQFRSGVHH